MTAPLPLGLRQLVEALLRQRVRALHAEDRELLKAQSGAGCPAIDDDVRWRL